MKIIDKCKSAVGPLGLAVALCFSAAPAAQATTLSAFLSFDGPAHITPPFAFTGGGEDTLRDDSLTFNTNPDGSVILPGFKTLSPGDTIYGIVSLSEIEASGRPSISVGIPSQIAALFSATVLATIPTPGGPLHILGPTPPGPDSLATICGTACTGASLTPTSIAVVLSTTQAANALPAGNADPMNWSVTGPNDFTGNFEGSNGNGVLPWFWEVTLGMTPGTDTFFHALDGGLAGSTERGAFDITSSAFPATWLPVDTNDFAGLFHVNDMTLDIGSVFFASAAQKSRGWDYRDQTTFFVNPLPEPGSLALMGLALAGLAGMAGRRRKQ